MPDDGFLPRPRSSQAERSQHDLQNLVADLDRIAERLRTHVAPSSLDRFFDGQPAYDAATVAVVRLHGVLERPEYRRFRDVLSHLEWASIRTIRNIAAHGGYRHMDDELFWVTVTTEVPDVVARLLAAASAELADADR